MEGPREKTTAHKSTETSKRVRLMVKDLARKAHEARAKGDPIAYMFISSAYDDVLRAMDIVTVGTENYAGLCAGQDGRRAAAGQGRGRGLSAEPVHLRYLRPGLRRHAP